MWPYRRHGPAIGRRRQEAWVSIGDLLIHHVETHRASLLCALFSLHPVGIQAEACRLFVFSRPPAPSPCREDRESFLALQCVSTGPACLLGSSVGIARWWGCSAKILPLPRYFRLFCHCRHRADICNYHDLSQLKIGNFGDRVRCEGRRSVIGVGGNGRFKPVRSDT